MSWVVVVIAALGVVAWVQAWLNYRAAEALLRELREETAAATELAETLKREECARDWRHMSTRGGLN